MSWGIPKAGTAFEAAELLESTVWTPIPTRIVVTGLIQMFPVGRLVPGFEIFADELNTVSVVIGNASVRLGVFGAFGAEFELAPGRHAYLWVDDFHVEAIDLSQYWAVAAAESQVLHCTSWGYRKLAKRLI